MKKLIMDYVERKLVYYLDYNIHFNFACVLYYLTIMLFIFTGISVFRMLFILK